MLRNVFFRLDITYFLVKIHAQIHEPIFTYEGCTCSLALPLFFLSSLPLLHDVFQFQPSHIIIFPLRLNLHFSFHSQMILGWMHKFLWWNQLQPTIQTFDHSPAKKKKRMIQHLMVAVKSAPHFSCSLHQREQMLGKVKNKVSFFKVSKEWTKIKMWCPYNIYFIEEVEYLQKKQLE